MASTLPKYIGNVRAEHGFEIQFAAPDSEAVVFYTQDHLRRHGYPLDIVPASEQWLGIVRAGQVWGVVGLKAAGPKALEIPDLYTHQSRWGILGAYAALEYLRDFARLQNIEVLTATPVWNTSMIKAMCRVFEVPGPTHVIMRYRPWEAN
jgi:hypothetical protein